ncbi:MAG: ThiF family adenylyltransferase [Planctomycetes bacterium]|nr:ThiF family adenylyltransferase [Planctomycetota bacterium]
MSSRRPPATRRVPRQGARRLTLVGLGNIGSHAADLLARLPDLGHVTLVDGDRYTASNLTSQAIAVRDIGQFKVQALARRLRQIAPDLTVRAIPQWVEDVPRAWLRADVLVACLDSRLARQAVNEIAWSLNTPWVDSGVDAADLLARVNVYLPGEAAPCGVCAWTDDDYAAIEQTYPCARDLRVVSGAGASAGASVAPRAAVPATGAAASLGALAAGLIATECQKLFRGELADLACHRQVLWDCRHHQCLVTSYTRNPHCRFDHAVWAPVPAPLRLGRTSLSAFGRWVCERWAGQSGEGGIRLGLAGFRFARQLRCPQCGVARACLMLDRGLASRSFRCGSCGGLMDVAGLDLYDALALDALAPSELRSTLAGVGLRVGDIVTVHGAAGPRHVEFVAPRPPARDPRSLKGG